MWYKEIDTMSTKFLLQVKWFDLVNIFSFIINKFPK